MKKWMILSLIMVLAVAGFGRSLKSGDTAPTIRFVIKDSTGQPVTGLTNTDLQCWYVQEANSDDSTETDGQEVPITDSALADPNSPWSAGGIVEIGHGMYRLDLPVAAVANNYATSLSVTIFYDAATDIYVHADFDITPSVNAALVGGTTPDDNVNVESTSEGAITAASIAPDAITSSKLADSAVLKLFAGPNYTNASTELDGVVEGTSLSTTKTIYLTTTSAANDMQYAPGRQVLFADDNGVYHLGLIEIYDGTADTMTLRSEVLAAPANLTPIYAVGQVESVSQYVPPPAGGTEVVTGVARAPGTNSLHYVYLAAGSHPDSGYYVGRTIEVVFTGGTYSGRTFTGTITAYTGDLQYSTAEDFRCTVTTAFPEVVTTGDTYTIYEPDPAGTGSDFGPNASNAVLEKAGSAAGSTLSTTTTIYLTDNTNDAIYGAGYLITFADASGLYHDAVIESNTNDTLTLKYAAGAAPADNTPIYSKGIGYTTLKQPLTNANIDASFINAISGDTIDDLIFRQPYAYYENIPKDSLGYMWLFPQWAATLAGIDRLDSALEDVTATSTTSILYFIPTPSEDRLLWTEGRGVLVEATTGDYTTYVEGIISSTSYNVGDGVLTVNLTNPLTATPKDQGNIYLRNSILPKLDQNVVNETSSVNATGSSVSTIVLDSALTTITDPTYCKILYYDASEAKYSTHICLSYSVTAQAITIFPRLTITPATADTVTIIVDFAGIPPRSGYFPG